MMGLSLATPPQRQDEHSTVHYRSRELHGGAPEVATGACEGAALQSARGGACFGVT